MNKVAMMVSREDLDSPLARTFGKAKWLLLAGPEDQIEFRRNEMLSGGSVAVAIAASGTRDVIAAHVGAKALAHLVELGVRVWKGPAGTPVRDVIASYARGALAAWQPDGSQASACASEGSGPAKRHVPGDASGTGPSTVVQIGSGRRRD